MKQVNNLFAARETIVDRTEELELVTTEKFAGLDIDFYRSGDDVFMTRKQIGEALGYSNPGRAMSDIHKSNKERLDRFSVVRKVRSTDGKYYNNYLYNEQGIYEIMRKSGQPKADAFYDFVYEIIEGMRKGDLKVVPSYQIDDPIERAKQWIEEEKRRQELEGEILQLTDTVEEYEPKVQYVDTILSSRDAVTVTQIAKDYGLSAKKLNELLHGWGVQHKVGGQWVLYAKHAKNGYTKSKTHSYSRSDGSTGTSMQTRWTQKGRLFIHNLLTDNGYSALMDSRDDNQLN